MSLITATITATTEQRSLEVSLALDTSPTSSPRLRVSTIRWDSKVDHPPYSLSESKGRKSVAYYSPYTNNFRFLHVLRPLPLLLLLLLLLPLSPRILPFPLPYSRQRRQDVSGPNTSTSPWVPYSYPLFPLLLTSCLSPSSNTSLISFPTPTSPSPSSRAR